MSLVTLQAVGRGAGGRQPCSKVSAANHRRLPTFVPSTLPDKAPLCSVYVRSLLNDAGGLNVPAIVWWKGDILPDGLRNTTNNKLYHVTDLLPTLARVVGAPIDDIQDSIDGMDVWDSIADPATPSPRTEIIHYVGPATPVLPNPSWADQQAASANVVRRGAGLLAKAESLRHLPSSPLHLSAPGNMSQSAMQRGDLKFIWGHPTCQGTWPDDPTPPDCKCPYG